MDVRADDISSPLDSLDPAHNFDEWEWVLYVMTLSFLIEGEEFRMVAIWILMS